jgi:hypothetical protein
VDTVRIGLRERAEYRGTIVDAIRPVEQRRPDRGLRDGGSAAGGQGALGACGETEDPLHCGGKLALMVVKGCNERRQGPL